MSAKLNARQQRFVDAIILGGTGHDAAIRAGYSPGRADPTASRLARNGKVASAIAEKQARIAARTEKTAADISRAMWAIITDPKAPYSARVSAAALEAKRYRDYSDKHDVSGAVGVLVRYTPLLFDIPPAIGLLEGRDG